jgi:hypothetical protein
MVGFVDQDESERIARKAGETIRAVQALHARHDDVGEGAHIHTGGPLLDAHAQPWNVPHELLGGLGEQLLPVRKQQHPPAFAEPEAGELRQHNGFPETCRHHQ